VTPYILVVEDDGAVRDVLATIAEDEGYRVLTAAGGGEALTLIEAERPALVVLDLMMPGLSGWEVLDELEPLPSPPPVIVVTALKPSAEQRARLEARTAAWLAKPFDIDALLMAVERTLARAG